MSLYVKIIDGTTTRVVAPLEVLNWDGSRWATPPEKRILVKIHDVNRDVWISPDEFRDDHYFFSQRFSDVTARRYEIYHPRYPKQRLTVSPGGSTHYVARSAPQQQITSGSHRIEVRLTPHHLVPFTGRDRFVFGANLAWLDGQYDHDFGSNFLYTPARSAYLDPTHTDYRIRLQNLETYFEHMRKGFECRVVRVWVFEGWEGLIHSGSTVAMDAVLQTSVQKILEIAEIKDLYIYWCLLTSKPEHRAFPMDSWIINSARNPGSSPFLNRALLSFCLAIQGHPRTFAIDVMNEPEKYVARGNVSWDVMRTYIRESCRKIKGYLGQSVLVSCGSKGTGWVGETTFVETMRNYIGLGLDFYDFHIYNDTGDLPMSYDNLYKELHTATQLLDKPCIVGECGQKRTGFLDDFQKGVVTNFMQQAWHLGFGGCLVWNYNYNNFEYVKRNIDHYHSLIYRNGSARPVAGPMSAFAGNYGAYML